MIDRIVEISVRNKLVVFIITAIGCLIGWWALTTVPLDALPDLGDTQVIVYSRWDRSPDVMEDQVTYPIVNAMVGAPRVKTVRGFSDFGYSYVYVVFEDGTDLYWARSRTLEYLSGVLAGLPDGVKTQLGPDATGLGWVYQYALVDDSGRLSLAELRSCQDWYLRFHLKSVRGVSEVAPVGGFTRQYQVNLDPNRLLAQGISLRTVVDAVREGNQETGGRLLDFGGSEYMVRGRGYARSLDDFADIVLKANDDGSTVRMKDVGTVAVGPDLRRGVADLDGRGEVVSGIVVMRSGENALDVIGRVKAKLAEVAPGLPKGVRVVPVYDRSTLIHRSIENVKRTSLEVIGAVVLIILLFLWHPPSATIPIVTIPVAILLAFIPFRLLGISANIMSLTGIVIAFGELIDASIVVVEQTHKKLELWESEGRRRDVRAVVLEGIKEVAGPTFFALLVMSIAFLPVLTLEGQEGRMFKPLAYTKSFAMLIAAVLAITLDPALRLLLARREPVRFRPAWLAALATRALTGPVRPEERHPISGPMMRAYVPVVRWILRWRWAVVAGAIALVAATVPAFMRLGAEFMPPLDEGAILYMPSAMPGISIGQAKEILIATDRVLKRFPQVEQVLGKAGRAETATDPAPLSMLETVVVLKPRSEWPRVPTWYSSWAPGWATRVLRRVTPDTISPEDLTNEMDAALRVPGVVNSWTMPVRGRIDMLTTGMRTPVGLKISGADLNVVAGIGAEIESILPSVRGTRSVFAERTGGGFFLDVQWKRDRLARYGLSIDDAQRVVANAIGGENLSTVVEGRARYPVNVRYVRDVRSDIDAVKRVLVPAGGDRQVPIGELADVTTSTGPAMIRDEDGLLTGYVYVDVVARDPATYVAEAGRLLKEKLNVPPGYTVAWSGQYEAMQRVYDRLKVVLPLTLAVILLLIFLSTRAITKTLIVMMAVPFSAVGAIWFLYLAGYNMSVGVWVGLIALLGVDAETGVFMLLYLDLAYEEARRANRLRNLSELRDAIVQGAAKRLRPKFMTFATTCIGLFPIMWATGTGSDLMKRIAAPMVGGIFTSFMLELLVYPAVYDIWKSRSLRHAVVSETDAGVEPA